MAQPGSSALDQSGRMPAAEKTAPSSDGFGGLLQHLPVAALIVDGAGNIIAGNKRWREFSGYSADDLADLNFRDLITNETHTHMLERVYENYFRAGFCKDLKLNFVRHDGTTSTGMVSAHGQRDQQGRITQSLVIIQDITREHAAELALKESDQRFSGTFDHAAHAMAIVSPQGRINAANAAFCEMLRMSQKQLQLSHVQDLVTEKCRPVLLNSVGRILAGEIASSRHELTFRAQPAKPVSGLTSISVVRDSAGTVSHFVMQIIDLTGHRETEARLRHAQKMEAVGQLTGGVAHDFNNLLQVVIGNLQLIEDQLSSPEAKIHTDEALRAASRGAELTRQLLAFSRRQSLDPEEVLVNDMIAGMSGMIRRSAGEAIEFKFLPIAGDARVRVDLTQLETALLNLVNNARDSMGSGGRLTVETGDAFLDEDYVAAYDDLSPGPYVLIAVSDTGTGIPQDVIDCVFEPFFTTKEEGQGSGLGLSMTYGFVKQSGGHLRIYSEEGAGTSVKMYLPRIDADGVDALEDEPICKPASAPKTVLVVEDQDDVRRVATGFVRSCGYQVLEAPDGIIALGLLQENPDIDLLFTDIVMPGGMNGFDLSRAACEINPRLKVIHASGFPKGAVIHQQDGNVKDGLLMKPYRKEELEEALSAAFA